MKLSKPIKLDFTKDNFIVLLEYGIKPILSPYSHKQIAEWCENFWNKYSDIDAPEDIESILPLLADVETQWDLFLANTYSFNDLKTMDFENVQLPIEWFKEWHKKANS